MIVFTDIDPMIIDSFVTQYELFDEYRIYDLGRIKFEEEIPRLFGIIPDLGIFTPEEMSNYTEEAFDRKYLDYLYNGAGFLAFMSIAMREYYRGDVSYIYVIDRSPMKDCFIEDLIKLLFERYGIESFGVATLEDLCMARRNNSLSVIGLNNIAADINRVLAINPKIVEDIQNGKI